MALDVETPTTNPAGAEPPVTELLELPATPRTITATRSGPLPVLVHDAPLVVPAREPAAPEALPESPVPDAVRPPRVDDRRSWLRLNWRAKAMIQSLLERVPRGVELHYLMQRLGGGMAHFERECDVKVEDWRLMVTQLRAAKVDLTEATFLEVGTGWYPTFPLCLYLAGASRVITFDITRHMRADMVRRLIARLAHHVPVIAKAAGAREIDVEARRAALSRALGRGQSLFEATWEVVDYRAPANAAETGLPARSVDVVFSNSVLEHVQPEALHALFREAWRVLAMGGLMFHSVNCGDHYAYTDSSINQLNYLKYSEQRWARWNNTFLYQNRLRAIDFTEAARGAGFAIERDTSRASPQRLAQLDRIRVDPCFAGYSREQLAITSIDFIARKPATR